MACQCNIDDDIEDHGDDIYFVKYLPFWPLGGKLPDIFQDGGVIPGNPLLVPLQQVQRAASVTKPIKQNLYISSKETPNINMRGHKQKVKFKGSLLSVHLLIRRAHIVSGVDCQVAGFRGFME